MKKIDSNIPWDSLLRTSPVLTTLASLSSPQTRQLRRAEIAKLTDQGNRAEDWTKVFVPENFIPDYIRGCEFRGECYLGYYDGTPLSVRGEMSLPNGLYDTLFSHVYLAENILCYNSGVIAWYHIAPGAVLFRNGEIITTKETAFGNGTILSLADETGGRAIPVFAEINLHQAAGACLARGIPEQWETFQAGVNRYCELATSRYGYIGEKAVIKNCASILESFIAPGAELDGLNLVSNSTILSDPEEITRVSHGCYIRNSIIQWGCELHNMCSVEDSVLTEHAHAADHAKIRQSLIGPNTGVSEGEVTASLVGPFVGFHHQALLIAAFWPEGKGNIAYGANVGSNHTGKAPDQEIRCGEGTFFGLGCNIKFPADYSRAPYSLIASGLTTLPQRLEFPFSLINSPASIPPGISTAYNELFPGWMLAYNIYALLRNEDKYAKRDNARRLKIPYTVFRPETVELMRIARDHLKKGAGKLEYYTNREIPGTGKNFIREEARREGVEAYTFHIRFFLLKGMLDRLCAGSPQETLPSLAALLESGTDDPLWRYQAALFPAEGLTTCNLRELLKRLKTMYARLNAALINCRIKDDVRGQRIIEDYRLSHLPATETPFIQQQQKILSRQIACIDNLLAF